MKIFYLLFTTLFICACATEVIPPLYKKRGEWKNKADETQLPASVVADASVKHEGGFQASTPQVRTRTVRSQGSSFKAAPVKVAGKPGELSVVLGPVTYENKESDPSGEFDAGKAIREVISQSLTQMKKLNLRDAPEERFNDDSPRPDLARKGIKYVIKGVTSYKPTSKENVVFLRVVDTASGKVAMIVSGRNKDAHQAASQAATRLVAKLKGVMK